MSVFLERQQVQRRRTWVKRLHQVERGLIAASIVVAGIMCFYGLYRLVFLGETFSVKKIVADGNWHYLSPDGVASLSGVKEGDNLFWVSINNIYDRLRDEPWIKNAAVRRGLPDTLWLFVEEYRPAAILVSDLLYYVDKDGTIIKPISAEEEKDLPVITGIKLGDENNLSDKDLERVRNMISLIDQFRETDFGKDRDVSEAHYDEVKGYSIVTRREPIQILFGQSDLSSHLARIGRMIAAIEARGQRIQYMLANEEGRIIVKYRST